MKWRHLWPGYWTAEARKAAHRANIAADRAHHFSETTRRNAVRAEQAARDTDAAAEKIKSALIDAAGKTTASLDGERPEHWEGR